MSKFTWVNGTKITPARVEVNGTVYDVTDAEYEGETPLSAANLNAMYDDIGDVDDLKTTSKTSAIDAINEVVGYNEYSTTEKIVGGWADNKPIYRKTFIYTSSVTQGGDTLIGSISNADTVIKIEGMAKITSDTTLWWMIPRVTNTGSTSTNWAIDVKISNNDVYLVKSTYGTVEKIILSVEYTKTS